MTRVRAGPAENVPFLSSSFCLIFLRRHREEGERGALLLRGLYHEGGLIIAAMPGWDRMYKNNTAAVIALRAACGRIN